MKLELSDSELKNLVRMVVAAESLSGYANDFIDDPRIATRARVWSKLEQVVLKHAYDSGLHDLVEKDGERYHLSEGEYGSIMEFTEEYDELSLNQGLANKLAWRDFMETHSAADINTMAKKSGGYLGPELHPLEEKYWQEFEEHDYSRLRIDVGK